jgi:hypothetical protein
LDKAIKEYTANYFPSGASSVYITEGFYQVYVVGNKYNPSNFWYI